MAPVKIKDRDPPFQPQFMKEEGFSVMKIASMVFGVVCGILALTIFFGSWYTINETERGVLLRNGAFVKVVQPGMSVKMPWIDTVYKIDMQTHTRVWDKMEAYSADQQPAHLKFSVTLHVSPDKVADIYSRFGGDIEAAISRLIGPHVQEKVKVVFGQYTAARAITDRARLNVDTDKALVEAIAYDPTFVIESTQVEDIMFSKDYIQSVENRMRAEVEVQQEQQKLAREKVLADIVVTQANGKANSVRAIAQAEADAKVLAGNAEATAIAARGKALGDNPRLIELERAQRWDGKLPSTMVPNGTLPMLELNPSK